MPAPDTTVCVIPRERFSVAVPALDALLADPDAPTRIVYFDGGSPPKVRDELERRARELDFTLIRSDAYVVPTAVRNLVFPRVDTEFTAFLDNDVFLSPGWLPRLEAMARDKGAAVVSPMYCTAVDDLATAKVHLAGAENHFTGEAGRRNHHMEFFHEDRDPKEVQAEIEPGPTEQAEFHLFFARTDALARVLPSDERFQALQEHIDLSLRIMDDGGTIWLDPQVVATNLMSHHLTLNDRRYFLLRWSRRWSEASLDRFCDEWGVDRNDPSILWIGRTTGYKRSIAYRPYRSPIGRLKGKMGRHSRSLPDHTIGPIVARYEDRRRLRSPEPRVVHLASWDRER